MTQEAKRVQQKHMSKTDCLSACFVGSGVMPKTSCSYNIQLADAPDVHRRVLRTMSMLCGTEPERDLTCVAGKARELGRIGDTRIVMIT